MLAMLDPKTQLCPRRTIRSKLVRDHHAWRRDGGFQELGHEPLRSAAISSTLDQDVENEAILVDGAPKPVGFSGNRNDDFIQMLFVAASRRPLADLIGEPFAELHRPLAHRLVGHADSARREHFLDHAKAQGKPKIEPDRMADDFRRKAMAAIERVTGSRHAPQLPRRPLHIR
jgi:hypothetical protein